jgi:hypothetical protein
MVFHMVCLHLRLFTISAVTPANLGNLMENL